MPCNYQIYCKKESHTYGVAFVFRRDGGLPRPAASVRVVARKTKTCCKLCLPLCFFISAYKNEFLTRPSKPLAALTGFDLVGMGRLTFTATMCCQETRVLEKHYIYA